MITPADPVNSVTALFASQFMGLSQLRLKERRVLVLCQPYKLGSASSQAVSCKAAVRSHSRAMSRSANTADDGLWARPSGGHQNAHHCVTAA